MVRRCVQPAVILGDKLTSRARKLLAGAGLLSLLVALTLIGSPSGHPAVAQAAVSSTTPIKHVVVIYQENNSFDAVLGATCAVRTTKCDGYTGTVTLKDGTSVAMHKAPDVVPIVNHNEATQVTAVNGGKMNGWAQISGCAAPAYACLAYWTPSQIPNLSALATKFAVSDRTFSMEDSPSWGGHIYVASATLDGFVGDNPYKAGDTTVGPGWGCDSKKVVHWRDSAGKMSGQPACVPDYTLDPVKYPYGGPYKATKAAPMKTIFDLFDAAGGVYRLYGAPPPDSYTGTNKLVGYPWAICPSFASCFYTNQRNSMVKSTQVLDDAANGTLPDYAVVTASNFSQKLMGGMKTSQHNGESMLNGDNWIGRVVSAIQNGPNWDSTAIFITYDDCGCFYEHVPPGTNPDNSRQGPREPMVIVSPYAKAGYTDSTPASFASILAYVEHNFGLPALTANDAGAYDYANSFDYNQVPLGGAKLTQHAVSRATIEYLRTHPTDDDDPT